jgi:glycerol uptake facilitator-like aquaporin
MAYFSALSFVFGMASIFGSTALARYFSAEAVGPIVLVFFGIGVVTGILAARKMGSDKRSNSLGRVFAILNAVTLLVCFGVLFMYGVGHK